ncbi:MAG: diacylglycerol kinase family protein [Gemmatimonadota bacterium]|nr:diacylglycerol kinase family protein [Gemmatimonadota bacterium]
MSPLGARPVCIWNPAAGAGLSEPDVRRILSEVPGSDRIRLAVTAAPRDAERHARDAVREGASALIVAGGDGTLHETVNGLPEAADTVPLGILPLGTANDFVRSAGLPSDPVEAARLLATGSPRRVDLILVELTSEEGSVERRRAVNSCAGGLGGEVSLQASDDDKARWGPLAYAKAALGLLTGEPDPCEVRVRFTSGSGESSLHGPVLAIIVSNGGRAGGGVTLAAGAEVDDRLLDLIVIRDAPLPSIATRLPCLLRDRADAEDARDTGQEEDASAILRRAIRRADIAVARVIPWSLDGESTQAKRIRLSVDAGGLTVIARRVERD